MDAQAVLGRLHKIVRVRHRGFPAWLCGIKVRLKEAMLLLYMNLEG